MDGSTNNPTPREVKALEDKAEAEARKAEAEAKKAEAEAKKAEVEAKEAELKAQQEEQLKSNALLKTLAPTYTTQGLEGNITLSGNLLVVNSLAMSALESCTKLIIYEIRQAVKGNTATLILYSEAKQTLLFQLAEVRRTLKQLVDTYNEYIVPSDAERGVRALGAAIPVLGAVAGGVELARGLLGTFADMVSLFKTDYQFSEQAVTVSNGAMVVALQQAVLRFNRTNGTSYKLVDPATLVLGDDTGSKLLKEIKKLKTCLRKAENQVAEENAKVEKDNVWIEQVTALNKVTQALFNELEVKGSEGFSRLSVLLALEDLQAQLDNQNTYLLRLTQEKSGGHVVASKNRVWPSKLMASGGVILSYLLMDHKGNVLTGNIVKEERSQRVI